MKLRQLQSLRTKKSKDKKIRKLLLDFELFKNAQEIFSYITHRGEVDTVEIIRALMTAKKVIVPMLKDKKLCLAQVAPPFELQDGEFGIPEPKFCLSINELTRVECALIPAVSFDDSGHRVGYGGGYIDRLLKEMRCTTIGLAYELQIVEKIPALPHDVPVDYIVTEKRVINCKKYIT